jgi:hypothetical protein
MLNATDVQLGLGAGEDGDHMVAHVATRCSGRGIVSLRGLMARGFSHRLLPCQRMTGSIEGTQWVGPQPAEYRVCAHTKQ